MSAVVFIDRLEPADSKRDALIGLLRESAESNFREGSTDVGANRYRIYSSATSRDFSLPVTNLAAS